MALAQLDQPVPPVTNLRSDVPTALAAVVASALAKRPSDRPADATQLAGALRGIEPMLTTQASTSLRLADVPVSGTSPFAPSSPAQQADSIRLPHVASVNQRPAHPGNQTSPPSAQAGYTGFQMPSIPTAALKIAPHTGQSSRGGPPAPWWAIGGGVALLGLGGFLVSPMGPWEIDLSRPGARPAQHTPAPQPPSAPSAAPAQCVPHCASGACNISDGCNGFCSCGPAQICMNNTCQCAPQCHASLHPCGSNGCGGDCGQCNPGWQCQSGDCVPTPGGQWRLRVVRATVAPPSRSGLFVRLAGAGAASNHVPGLTPRWDWTAGSFYPEQLIQQGITVELWDDGGWLGRTYRLCSAVVRPSQEDFWSFGAEIAAPCALDTDVYFLLEPVR